MYIGLHVQFTAHIFLNFKWVTFFFLPHSVPLLKAFSTVLEKAKPNLVGLIGEASDVLHMKWLMIALSRLDTLRDVMVVAVDN